MVTVLSFLTSFPEFKSVDLALIQAKLTEALAEVDATVWGVMTDTGVGYLTAHKLALSPFGQNARLVNKDQSTTYERHFRDLVKKIPAGFRVP